VFYLAREYKKLEKKKAFYKLICSHLV